MEEVVEFGWIMVDYLLNKRNATFKDTTIWIGYFAFTSSLDPIGLGRFFRAFGKIKVFYFALWCLKSTKKWETVRSRTKSKMRQEKRRRNFHYLFVPHGSFLSFETQWRIILVMNSITKLFFLIFRDERFGDLRSYRSENKSINRCSRRQSEE